MALHSSAAAPPGASAACRVVWRRRLWTPQRQKARSLAANSTHSELENIENMCLTLQNFVVKRVLEQCGKMWPTEIRFFPDLLRHQARGLQLHLPPDGWECCENTVLTCGGFDYGPKSKTVLCDHKRSISKCKMLNCMNYLQHLRLEISSQVAAPLDVSLGRFQLLRAPNGSHGFSPPQLRAFFAEEIC